jgi:hypothetical protein
VQNCLAPTGPSKTYITNLSEKARDAQANRTIP